MRIKGAKHLIRRALHRLFPSRVKTDTRENLQAARVVPWFQANGDRTLRLQYSLDPNSVVFDLGGYEGQWASDIFAMYGCNVFVFEPVKNYAKSIQLRFSRNPKIRVFDFGLGQETKTMQLAVNADSSSTYRPGAVTQPIALVKASDFLATQCIGNIALMKINIEGGEYDLIEHLIESGLISKIDNVQVQFHDFVPAAEERMRNIQSRLTQTHELTYQYVFVWENWRRR